jgi:Protein of unknown function (DUF3379)
MNCLDFRRLKLADPNRLPADARAHASACASCAEFTRAQDDFEGQLGEAVRVPLDASLGARVLLRQQLKHANYRRVFARAAVVVLACAVLLGVGMRMLAPDAALFDVSAAHVAREPKAFMADERRSNAELDAALAYSGAKLVRPIEANISYIHNCPVPGGLGKHIIMRTGAGTITLLTMPNKKVYFRKVKLKDGYVVALLPCKHGSVALVARSEGELAALEAQLREHVQWSA